MGPAMLSSQNSTSPPGTFTYFPKLPVELRLKIWNLAIPPARVVVISSRWEIHEFTSRIILHLRNLNELPLTVQICQETRARALRLCKPALGRLCWNLYSSSEITYASKSEYKPRGYINYATDSVYITSALYRSPLADMLTRIRAAMYFDIGALKSVAFDLPLIVDTRSDMLMEFLVRDPAVSVEELVLVLRHNMGYRYDQAQSDFQFVELQEKEVSMWSDDVRDFLASFAAKLEASALDGSMPANSSGMIRQTPPKIRLVGLTRDGVRL